MIAALSARRDPHERGRDDSVLTRLPQGRARTPAAAAQLHRGQPPDAALALGARERAGLPTRLAAAGVSGGSVYDGLVALEADAHGETLVSLDHRAARIYAALGIRYRLL